MNFNPDISNKILVIHRAIFYRECVLDLFK
jgi:hypothetical protein